MEVKSPEYVENNILVVDDDATILPAVAMILSRCNYQVVTVKDVLTTLQIKGDSFDLIVTDVHKPDMNGFELQQVITQVFELPVLSMSADNKEGTILKGLKGVPADDLKEQGLYTALQDKKGKRAVHGKSAMKLGKQRKDNSANFAVPTKSKIIWTVPLHNRFLEAIRNIGFDKAVPKNILDHMNVPGLTRENIGSHLQKYRIYLRRVTASCRNQVPDINLASRANQSAIASGTIGKHSQSHPENFGVQSRIPTSLIHSSTDNLTGSLQHLKNKGKEVDAELDPVRNFSVFHNVNATQGSQGNGDLSASFMNQGNAQPHQQNNEDEVSVNFDGGSNQDMEKEDHLQ